MSWASWGQLRYFYHVMPPMPLFAFGSTVMITMMAGCALVLSVRVHRYSEGGGGKGALL